MSFLLHRVLSAGMEEKGAKDSLSITVDHAVIPVIEILKVVGDETNIVDFHKNRMRAAEEAGKVG